MVKKEWRYVCTFLILFSLLLPIVHALGLTGAKLRMIIYEPGKSITNTYTLSDTDKEVDVVLSTNPALQEYISLTPVINNQFDLVIQFPQGIYPPPGRYELSIRATEREVEGSGASAFVGVVKSIPIEVYSWNKDIHPNIGVENVNQGTPLRITAGATSRTYNDIDAVYAELKVRNPSGKEIGTRTTNTLPLKALQSTTLSTTPFETTGLTQGEYSIEGTFFYDGLSQSTTTIFLIGILDLVLKEYTTTLTQGFSEFTIVLYNNWGNDLTNVYAKLFIDGKEILQTPTTSIGPWKTAEMKSIINVDFAPGTYSGELELFYEGKTKKVPVTLTVKEKSAESMVGKAVETPTEDSGNNGLTSFLLAVIVVLFLVICGGVIWFIFQRRGGGARDDSF